MTLIPTAVSPPKAASARPTSVPLEFSRICWEYNSSAKDLGVHVTLDGEDWINLRIRNPNGKVLFDVRGSGSYKQLGMTELFFEGAEPSPDEFPLQELLGLSPGGEYEFEGQTVDGALIEGEWQFKHAIPAGPAVSADVGGNDLVRIHGTPVAGPLAGLPDEPIVITGYQVLVDPCRVIVPANVHVVTLPPEFVASLALAQGRVPVRGPGDRSEHESDHHRGHLREVIAVYRARAAGLAGSVAASETRCTVRVGKAKLLPAFSTTSMKPSRTS